MIPRLVPVALVSVLAVACENEPVKHTKHVAAPPAPTGIAVDSAKLSLFTALPDKAPGSNNPFTDEKLALGRALYHDARLSKGQKLSCNGCHDLAKTGVDGTDFSEGDGQKKLPRNTPTVFNAALQASQYWDGHYETLEDATRAMLVDPAVMAEPEARLVDTLKSIPGYVDAFKKAYPDAPEPITLDGAVKAIALFERSLLTPSPWDQYLKGEQTALTDEQKTGFLKFVDVGCPTCHVGALVGATMFQKLGKEKPWPNLADKGRSGVTKSPSDDMMFKVSSLRNVERTAPYFHDASSKTLEDAVKTMASHQLAKDLGDDDVKSIVAWLKSLTGTPPESVQNKPEPFPSGPKTPKPSAK
ncbi:MAG TPA: cytochrome c peroxidase [Polyangiaceae bacterium]|jgi:cytochrome c peroxidase|nr:cytochrome c peroxidase [Polyangiaceae bacterium]